MLISLGLAKGKHLTHIFYSFFITIIALIPYNTVLLIFKWKNEHTTQIYNKLIYMVHWKGDERAPPRKTNVVPLKLTYDKRVEILI